MAEKEVVTTVHVRLLRTSGEVEDTRTFPESELDRLEAFDGMNAQEAADKAGKLKAAAAVSLAAMLEDTAARLARRRASDDTLDSLTVEVFAHVGKAA